MSNTSPSWFGSDEREVHCSLVTLIPAWKRFILCYLSYTTWQRARALGKAAVFCLHNGEPDAEMFDRLVFLSDIEWCKIYNLPHNPSFFAHKYNHK